MIELKEIIVEWEGFKSKFKDCFGFEFRSLEDVVNNFSIRDGDINWHDLIDWERIEDIEIFQRLAALKRFSGDIYVITEASYRDSFGPFKLNAMELEEFVCFHLDMCGECFFNGDVLITSLADGLIWAFHHEGVFAFIAR